MLAFAPLRGCVGMRQRCVPRADRRLKQEKGRCAPEEPLIAVIDDDELFRSALAESLRSLGYRAREFASADQFIALDGEGSCGCIVTDIQMPGMSGLDLKRLLALRGSKTPIIMMTARAEPDLEGKVAVSGAICLLRKPFESVDLIACLERALGV